MPRLELNKRALDPDLDGRVSLYGLKRFPYMKKGFKGQPEMVLVYPNIPEEYEPGLRELVDEPSCEEIEGIPGEKRFRFPNYDLVLTGVGKDDELLQEEKDFLDENEVFCMYLDEPKEESFFDMFVEKKEGSESDN